MELFVSRNELTPTVSLRGGFCRRGNLPVRSANNPCTQVGAQTEIVTYFEHFGQRTFYQEIATAPLGPRNDMVVFTWLRRFEQLHKLKFDRIYKKAADGVFPAAA